jgi:hypothetical protein
MFCNMIKIWKRIRKVVVTAATVLANKIEAAVRRLWRRHGSRVASDPAYAAATAVVISSCLGFVPAKDAIAAVVALLLGVHLNSRPTHQHDSYSPDMSRWDSRSDWDLV